MEHVQCSLGNSKDLFTQINSLIIESELKDISIENQNQQTNSNLVIQFENNNNNNAIFTKTPDEQQNITRHVHIPYILNGELYQIITQDGENVTVQCRHCPPDRVYRGSVRSTGNFHMHIKRRHPDLLEKLHNMKVNALLERRDRLMRNRKFNNRPQRNRNISTVANSTNVVATSSLKMHKNEATTVCNLPSLVAGCPSPKLPISSESDIAVIPTNHSLKIKTVFQRHQMQQKEAAEMRNWSNAEFLVLPIAKTANEISDQPINYSKKSYEENCCKSTRNTCDRENIKTFDEDTNIPNSNNANLLETQQQKHLEINEYFYESQQQQQQQTNAANPVSSPFTSSSVLSTYSSNQHQHLQPTNLNLYQSNFHNNLAIIKSEHILTSDDQEEEEAMDLTVHKSDSGIFSNTSSTLESDIEMQNSAGANNLSTSIASKKNHRRSASNTSNECSEEEASFSRKLHELFDHVESSLRDIQHQMNLRNQIESNRMFLELAKFKFLHPGFQFNL